VLSYLKEVRSWKLFEFPDQIFPAKSTAFIEK